MRTMTSGNNMKVPDVTEVFPIKPLGLSIREIFADRIILTIQEKRKIGYWNLKGGE